MQDLKYAFRQLAKAPGFTAIAVVVLALGICSVTTQFNLINGVLLRGMPFPESERLVSIDLRNPAWPPDTVRPPFTADFRAWQEQQQTCEGLAAHFSRRTFNVTIGNVPEHIGGAYVTHNFFRLLGIKPALGRDFNADQDRGGVARVALISDNVWKQYFGGAPDIIGRTMRLEGNITTVIGVMPPRFSFPRYEGIWVTLFAQYPERPERTSFPGSVIGRLKPGVSLDQATVEFIGIARRLAQEFPDTNKDLTSVRIEPLLYTIVGRMRDMLYAMLVAAGLVLTIACVNVMNLQFSRASARTRELAVRGALGASRVRLLRQMLTEGALLVGLGATAGVTLSYWTTGLLHKAMDELPFGATPGWINTNIDLRVLAFTVGIVALSVLGSSLVPAWLASRVNVVEVIKEGGPGHTNRRVNRLTQGLVVAQITLTCVLLVAALLQVKSIAKQSNLNMGFDQNAVMSARLGLNTDYRSTDSLRTFYRQFLQELRANPSFTHVALTSRARMVGEGGFGQFEIEGVALPAGERGVPAAQESISDGYFAALGLKPRLGREFEPSERESRQPTALINESFAQKYFSRENPIGRRLRPALFGRVPAPWRTIVGVVPDTLMQGPIDKKRDGAGVFLPLEESPLSYLTAIVRGQAPAETLVEPLRRAVLRLDPNLPIYAVGTPRYNLLGTLGEVRVIAELFAVFAAIAIVLATVGLYGVTSFAVSRRTQEFGIRMALGADRRRILLLVLRQGGVQFLIGAGVGLALVLGLTHFYEAQLAEFLYKVPPRDLFVYGAVLVLLAIASAIACLVPARRATRVNPVKALRAE